MSGSNKTNINPSALHNKSAQHQDQSAKAQRASTDKEAELKNKEQRAFAKKRLENQIQGPKQGNILNTRDEDSNLKDPDKTNQPLKGETWSGRIIDHIKGV